MVKRRALWITILLLINFFLILGIDNNVNLLSNIIRSSTNFVFTLTGQSVKVTKAIINSFESYKSIKSENEQLKKTINEYQTQFKSIEALLYENSKLRTLLQFNYSINYRLFPAHIITSVRGEGNDEFLIDRGLEIGIDVEMIVCAIYKQRLVLLGKITQVRRKTAIFTSIQKRGFSLPIISAESEQIGILKGIGATHKNLDVLFDSIYKSQLVFVGEEIQVQEYSTMFPQGIPIGIITDVSTNTEDLLLKATVEPFILPQNVDVVLVLMPKETS